MEAELGRIEVQELRAFVHRCMKAVGCTEEQASIVSEILVEADLRGVHRYLFLFINVRFFLLIIISNI